MTSNLIDAIVGLPALAAILATIFVSSLGRARSAGAAIFPVLHLALLALAAWAFRATPDSVSFRSHVDLAQVPLDLSVGRATSVGLVAIAVGFLALSAVSRPRVQDSRHGSAFLALLLIEQAGANLSLAANNLLTLMPGLLLISLSLATMVGLDFAEAGRSAALRLLVTLELPSAVGLAAIWLVAARTGLAGFSNLDGRIFWPTDSEAIYFFAPLAVAFAARGGLFPLHRWVVAGARASAAPVVVAIAGLALPLGGVALARIVGAMALGGVWALGLQVIGAATAVTAGWSANRERTPAGWLARVAIAQLGFATLCFGAGSSQQRETGWLILAGGGLGVTTVGLSLILSARASPRSGDWCVANLRLDPRVALCLAIGCAAILPLPPFATYTARVSLVGGLLTEGTIDGGIEAIAVLFATFLLAASGWRVLLGPVDSALPEGADRVSRSEWDTLGALGAIVALTVAAGLYPSQWLLTTAGPIAPEARDGILDVTAAILVGLTVASAIGWQRVVERVTGEIRGRPRLAKGLLVLPKYVPLNRLSDPYVVIGRVILGLGRVSATLLDQTLGRLVRSN